MPKQNCNKIYLQLCLMVIHLRIFSSISSFLRKDKPTNYFSMNKCTPIAYIFFRAMPNSRFPVNFQFNFLAIEARASLQTLSQSLKQKDPGPGQNSLVIGILLRWWECTKISITVLINETHFKSYLPLKKLHARHNLK